MTRRDKVFTVLSNREIAPGIYRSVIESSDGAPSDASPGQFAMVRVTDATIPLLRRPISYLGAKGKSVEFVYRVVGAGTGILSRAQNNDKLRLLGPLGKGFNTSPVRSRALLVAGGIGVAPLYFLAKALRSRPIDDVELIYGVCNSGELILVEELENAGVRVSKVTEDGSAGAKGMASEIAIESMRNNTPDAVFACGPHPMLRAVALEADRRAVPCQVSVEARMACGVGACLGCSIETNEGYKCACADGPVFDARALF